MVLLLATMSYVVGISPAPARRSARFLVSKPSESRYLVLFSLFMVLTMTWMVFSYGDAPLPLL
mgnify:CR=1 FL=1